MATKKLTLQEMVDEWCSIRKAYDNMGKALEKMKGIFTSIPKDKWTVDANGKKYLWSEAAGMGIALVVPENRPVLDKEKAIAHCVQNKLKSCLKYSLNETGFQEACESGVISTDVLNSLMSPPENPKSPYIQKMENPPKNAPA